MWWDLEPRGDRRADLRTAHQTGHVLSMAGIPPTEHLLLPLPQHGAGPRGVPDDQDAALLEDAATLRAFVARGAVNTGA